MPTDLPMDISVQQSQATELQAESLPFLSPRGSSVRVLLRGCVVCVRVRRRAAYSLSLFLSFLLSFLLHSLTRSLVLAVNRNPRCFSSRVFVARKKPPPSPKAEAGTACCLSRVREPKPTTATYTRSADGRTERPESARLFVSRLLRFITSTNLFLI